MSCYIRRVNERLGLVWVLAALSGCTRQPQAEISSALVASEQTTAHESESARESHHSQGVSTNADPVETGNAGLPKVQMDGILSTPLMTEEARLAPSVTGASGCKPLRTMPPAPGTFRFVTDPVPARQRCPKDSVAIPGGGFRLDNRTHVIDSHGRVHPMPPTTENVEPFCIGITEVTEQMLRDSGLQDDAPASQWPAVVSYATAERYCEQQALRLPTRGEWLMTVYASSQSPFPWGYEFSMDGVCWLRAEGPPLCKVGTSPKDVTPEGVFDMVANAREWTLAVRMQEYVDSVVLGAPSNDCIGTLLYGDLRKNSLGNTDVDVNGFRCVYPSDN